MSKPVVTFAADITTAASPRAVYDVLADLSSHRVWAGEQAKHKNFKLLSLDAPAEAATVGTSFSSVGENGNGHFHDVSTVTSAEPGRVFAFDTASYLDRKHGKRFDVTFRHRYALEQTAQGTRVHYTCAVGPVNYRPYWLKPGVKQLTKVGCRFFMKDNLANLARLAESASVSG